MSLKVKPGRGYSATFCKKIILDIYRTQIRPSDHDIVAISVTVDIVGHKDSIHGFDSVGQIANLGTVMYNTVR